MECKIKKNLEWAVSINLKQKREKKIAAFHLGKHSYFFDDDNDDVGYTWENPRK